MAEPQEDSFYERHRAARVRRSHREPGWRVGTALRMKALVQEIEIAAVAADRASGVAWRGIALHYGRTGEAVQEQLDGHVTTRLLMARGRFPGEDDQRATESYLADLHAQLASIMSEYLASEQIHLGAELMQVTGQEFRSMARSLRALLNDAPVEPPADQR